MPLFMDLGRRMAIGMMAGFGGSFFLCKSWESVRFFSLCGAGVGLGLNYTQLRVLYHQAAGTFDTHLEHNQKRIMDEIEDIEREMRLLSKLEKNYA